MIVERAQAWVSHKGVAVFDLEGVENGERIIRRFEISQSVLDHVLLKLTQLVMDVRENDRHRRSE